MHKNRRNYMESQIQLLIYLVPACAALALIVAYALAKWISNVIAAMKE